METLKYKIIKSRSQYNQYCKDLENLLEKTGGKSAQDEIDLLTLLIEKWDSEHTIFKKSDPINMLIGLMEDHGMKSRDLVDVLDVSKGYVSEILNYKKGLSKDVIRKLAGYFKMSQEAFNRPYKLKVAPNAAAKNINSRNKKKKLKAA